MKTLDLFPNLENSTPRTLADLIDARDKKGVVDYLRTLTNHQFFDEVLKAGLSMIGHHHGKPAMIDHVVRQLLGSKNG